MNRWGLWLVSGLFLALPCYGATVFVSQSGGSVSCGADGTQSTTAIASISWVAGNTYKLCGTLTSTMTVGASGTAGNPITIFFETGAKFSKANWGNVVVINFSNRDWITVDGGATGSLQSGTFVANGLIENTAVSSTSNPTVDTTAIQAMPTNNSIVKNMLIGTLYNKTIKDGNGGGDGIHLQGSNDLITNNDGLDMKQGFTIDCTSGGASNSVITGNRMHRFNWSFLSSDRNAATTCTNLAIHDNESYDTVNWDDDTGITNNFHHNGVFISMTDPTNSSKQIGLQIYNNYFHGDPGDKSTSMPGVFLDNETSGATYTGTLIFNNLMVNESLTNTPSNAPIIVKSNGSAPAVKAYNNTIFYQTANKGRCMMVQGAALTAENNIGQACSSNIFISSGTVPTSDYNDFYLSGGSSVVEGPHSITTNPTLSGVYVPNAGSPVIGAALNLTSLGVVNLDSDKAGTARPASLPWDMGAYQAASGPAASLSPTTLPFSSVIVGNTSVGQSTTLRNTGGATLNISSIALGGAHPGDYAISANTCSSTLASSATCIVTVTFTPTTTGSRPASLIFTTDAPTSPDTVTLTGTGITVAPVVSLSPTSLAFGNQAVNTTSSGQQTTLTNTGTATLTISNISITGTNSSQFSGSSTCGGSLSAGLSCVITVTFTPTTAGSKTANVSITSNAASSVDTVPLTGTGVSNSPTSVCRGCFAFKN